MHSHHMHSSNIINNLNYCHVVKREKTFTFQIKEKEATISQLRTNARD